MASEVAQQDRAPGRVAALDARRAQALLPVSALPARAAVIKSKRQADIASLLKQDGLTDEELLHIRQLHLQMDGPKLQPQAKVRAPYDSLYLKTKASNGLMGD